MAKTLSPSIPTSRASRWSKRALIGFLVLANSGVFGVYFLIKGFERKIAQEVTVNNEVVGELSATPARPGDVSTFLIIGSDSREDLPDDLGSNFDLIGGRRADVIMLVQILPREGRAQILSIPRDLEVQLEGRGRNKINAAFAFGGGPLVVNAVKDATGLPIHHFVEVDFGGFAALVDEMGGIEFNFAYPSRDLKSGLRVDAGPQILNGATALAYARSRSFQEFRGGEWVSVEATDIGRTHRQQQILLAIIAQMKRPSTLTQAGDLIEAFGQHLSVDASLVGRGLIDLAWAMRDLRADSIEAVTYPTETRIIDELYYEVPDEPDASAILSAFRSGESMVAGGEGPLHLQVLNGNGTKGIAGHWAEELQSSGFVVDRVADASSFDFPVTQLVAAPDHMAQAVAVADALGFGEAVSGQVPSDIDVLVIIGADGSNG